MTSSLMFSDYIELVSKVATVSAYVSVLFCTARQLDKLAVWWEWSCQLHGTCFPVWLQVIATIPQSFLYLGFSWQVVFFRMFAVSDYTGVVAAVSLLTITCCVYSWL